MPSPGKPPPGMVKLRCTHRRYWFAVPAADVKNCPDCALRLRCRPPVEQRQEAA